MAKKQYNGAKASIFIAAAGAVLFGSAWLANQPAAATQAASGAVVSGAIPSGAASTTISAAPAATATSAPRPVIKATKSRGS